MSRRLFLVAGVGAVSGLRSTLSVGAPASRPTAAATLGQSAPGFEMYDATGRARSLSEFKGKPVVLEWSSPSCPFTAAQYKSGRMQELQRWAMGRGGVWLTVLSSHPSRSDCMPGAQAEAFDRLRGGLWQELHVWLQLERNRVPDGSAIAKAIDYSLNHWAGLGRFLLDGAVPIDNNHIENQMRPWALGRRNWLFIGSQLAGERAAVVMSLLQSAKLNGHEPWAYLKDVLTRLPTQLNSRIGELLPHQWQRAN